MHRLKRYSIVDLAESLKRGGDLRRGKYERGLSGMQLEVLGNHGRAGAALPTVQLARDLEVGLVDGGQALAVTTVLPVAEAVRPETVFGCWRPGGATPRHQRRITAGVRRRRDRHDMDCRKRPAPSSTR